MKRVLLFLAALFLIAPLRAVPEPSAQELEQNRRLLEKYREHPDKYGQLTHNAQAFLALSPERREQILKLDHDLHEEPSAVQARLKNVLTRYSDWLARLEPAERKKVLDTTDRAARLELI